MWRGPTRPQHRRRGRHPARYRRCRRAGAPRAATAAASAGQLPSRRGLLARQQGGLSAVRAVAAALGRPRASALAVLPVVAGERSGGAVRPVLLLRQQRRLARRSRRQGHPGRLVLRCRRAPGPHSGHPHGARRARDPAPDDGRRTTGRRGRPRRRCARGRPRSPGQVARARPSMSLLPSREGTRNVADADSSALTTWLASRVAVAILAVATLWTVTDGRARDVRSWVSGWDHWDTGLFVKVARYGYQGYPEHYRDHGIVAFFPGEPLALRAVHLVVRNWIASGLLISAVGAAVACVALARLAALDAGRVAGLRAPRFLVLSPYAVFLFAVYSESLFLALALPAWLSARRGRWVLAGTLGAGAGLVRVTGLFLAAALVIQWLVEPGGERRWRDLLPLSLPFASVAAYVVYLHHISSDWLAWPHAQRDNWGRSLTAPWTALHTTWNAATAAGQGAAYSWSFRAEVIAMAVGVVLSVLLAVRRRWAELVY